MYGLYLKMKKYFKFDVFKKLKLNKNDFIVLTLHRSYNVDEKNKLKKIIREINKINKKIKIVFPIHPRTKRRIKEFRLKYLLKDLLVIKPLDYLDLMGLVEKCKMVITDSGGLQKEAYFAHKESVVLMPDTGWRELITNKWNILADENNLYNKVFSKNKSKYTPNIYGTGKAGERIVKILLNCYSL